MSAKRRRSKSSNLPGKSGKALSPNNRGSSQKQERGLAGRTFQKLSSRSNIQDWSPVEWADVLGRAPFHIDLDSVHQVVAGKVVLVTGAAGSIGSQLCRRILECGPAKLVCLDHGETSLFYLQMELGLACDHASIIYCVEDFSHSDAMRHVFDAHQIDVVFHAAGYKHVPMMEQNPRAALENNVFGLMRFLDVCEAAHCKAFVLISSDKAVNPTSIMGCTKRLGELILASRPNVGMRCISVRFGNVLGSQGSVAPVFYNQIMSGHPLTVTDRDATRLFITADEAVSLLLVASSIGRHSEILSLEMGEPVRILDLARKLIRLCGKSEGDDANIIFTGLRLGEKLHEELFYKDEQVLPTSCDRIRRAVGPIPNWSMLKSQLDILRDALYTIDDYQLRFEIQRVIPEYRFKMKCASADDARMRVSKAGQIGRPQTVVPANLTAQLGCD